MFKGTVSAGEGEEFQRQIVVLVTQQWKALTDTELST